MEIDERSPRGDHEFVLVPPPGFVDLSSEDKAAAAPFLVLRQAHDDDARFSFVAVAMPPQRAFIEVRVQPGRLRILPTTPDQLRFGLPPSAEVAFVRSEIVTLSQTAAVRLDFVADDNHFVSYYVPGRERTAAIRCACRRAELERYEPLFTEFAVNAARGAETAPKSWSEVERERMNDPRRSFLGLKLGGLVMAFGIAGLVLAATLDLDPSYGIVGGALVGVLVATVRSARRQRLDDDA